jgi:nucleoside-diphosphate-sugar epimerase
MTNSKTILVTGCAGFIGANFTRQFRLRYPQSTVIGIDNFSTGRKEAVTEDIVFYEGSVLEDILLNKIFRTHRPEYIFHFAALPSVAHSLEFPRRSTEVNVVGTVALLEASKKYGVTRFIYSSSSSIYGGAKKLPTKESDNPPNPKSPYAVQKYVNEPFCQVFSNLFGMDTISLRYFNAFGPGQFGTSAYASVIPAWLNSIYFPSSGKGAYIEGDGSQSRDFCYVDNIVDANILAMKTKGPFQGDVFNIAHGKQTSLKEVVVLIEKYSGYKLNPEIRPARLGDIKHSCADITKAERTLGYQPSISFEEGLKKTIEWFKLRAKNETG